MLLLDSTAVINLISGSTGDIDVATAFVDINQTTNAVAVQAPDIAHITTAATTVIVPAPSAGIIRNVKNITVTNEAATANLIEIELNNGYGVRLIRATLAANEALVMGEDGQWDYYAANGALQLPTGIVTLDNYGISGNLAETMPRNTVLSTNNAALVSGTLFLQAIYLRAGTIVSNISFCSATAGVGTATNQIFGLYDGNRNLLASTANDGATGWASNAIKTLNIAVPYTVKQTGLYYLGIMVAATTVPTLSGNAGLSSSLHGVAPALHGTSTTALTTALPNPAAAITTGAISIWGCVK